METQGETSFSDGSQGDTARTVEIRERRRLLEETASRLKELEQEHMKIVKKAAFMTNAAALWSGDSRGRFAIGTQERRQRENILAALRSQCPPDALKWGDKGFNSMFGRHHRFQSDREILLARLDLEDFESTFLHETFPVPSRLRGDKEVMLKVVSKNSNALELATKALKNDRDVVLAAISQRFHFAVEAIQHASLKLRGDKKIARAVLRRDYGIRAFKHLASKLQNDYKLALLAIKSSSSECSRSYEHLSELPSDMLDDEEIVLAAVKKRGSNLRFVMNKGLLNDMDIVQAACKNDGNALQYVPRGATRKEMLTGNNLMAVLTNGGGRMLECARKMYRTSREYLLVAVENGFVLDTDDFVDLYQTDRDLFVQVIHQTSSPHDQFICLREHLQSDEDIGLSFLSNDYSCEGLACAVLKTVPQLCRNAEAKLVIAKKGLFGAFNEFHGVWDEKPFVMAACQADVSCYRYVSDRIKADPDVVKILLSSSTTLDTILLVPSQVFQQHHDIAAMAIKACDLEYPEWLHFNPILDHFGRNLHTSRLVVLEWARKGWPLYELVHLRSTGLGHDADILLAAIKFRPREILNADIGLQGNSSFLKSSIEANSRVIGYAPESLRYGFDIMLLAIGSSADALHGFDHSRKKDFDALVDFASKVREKLSLTDGFILHFLGGISIAAPKQKRAKRRRGVADRCHLPMLDVGYETGSVLKKRIAEYAGVPIGPELKLLRPASDNLALWGY